MVTRKNSWQDAYNTGVAQLDLGDGIVVPLPVDGILPGEPGPPGAGVPVGGAALQVIRKNAAATAAEWVSLDKSLVGLSSADNTADVDKPVSAAQAVAIAGKVAKGELVINVKDYGAVGDGVADDTAAIQAALATPYKWIVLPHGTFRASSDLSSNPVFVSAVAGRRIMGQGVITATTQVTRLFDLTAADQTITINVAGNENIANAIRVSAAGCIVENCRITDLKSTTFSVMAIQSVTSGGVIIRGNYIKGLNSVGDVTGGNGNGLTRGVGLGLTAAATRDSIIENNIIIDCMGEEGDSIQVLCSNGAGTYYDGRAIIRNNIIDTFSRRAIKTQAGRTKIVGNYITSSITDSAIIPNRMNVIAVIQGGDQMITDNVIENCQHFSPISAQYEESKTYNNITILRNRITGVNNTVTTGIFVNTGLGSGVSIADNHVEGVLIGVSVGQTDSVSIRDNTIVLPAGTNTSDSIGVSSSCTKVEIVRNRLRGGVNASFINNQATGTIIEYNTNYTDSVFFKSSNSAKQAIIGGNKNMGVGATISGAGAILDNYHYGFVSPTTATNNFPAPMFARASPATEYPALNFKVGQRFINSVPVAGGTEGWVCTVAGTGAAATFKTFGSISA